MKTDEIYKGTIIKTNRGREFIWEVTEVIKDCTCPDPMCWYEGREEKPTKPHYHLELKQLSPVEPGMSQPGYMNSVEFRSGEWRSIFERYKDEIEFQIIEQPKSVQLNFF